MIISKKIEVKPFETFAQVVIGDTIKEGLEYWEKNIKPNHGLDISKYCTANGLMLSKVEDGITYYGIILYINSPYSTIVHELFHLMMNVSNEKGASWSEESDEFYAYCLSDLWEQVAILYDEYKKKNERNKA